MSELIETMKKYEDFVDMAKGASQSEIEEAEKELGVTFSEEYKNYTKEAGSASANGHELTGVVESKRLNVISATKDAKLKNENIPSNLYVVEAIGVDGIIAWQDSFGVVYESGYKSDVKKVAESLAEYVAL